MIENDKKNDDEETKAESEEHTTVDAEIVEDIQAEAISDPEEPSLVDPEEPGDGEQVSDTPTEEDTVEAKSGSSLPFYAVAVLAAVIVGTVIVVSGNQETALTNEQGIVISDAGEESTILFPVPRTADGPIVSDSDAVVGEADESPVPEAAAVETDQPDMVEDTVVETEEPALATMDEEVAAASDEPSADQTTATADVEMVADVADVEPEPVVPELSTEALNDTETGDDLDQVDVAEQATDDTDDVTLSEQTAENAAALATAEAIEAERAEGLRQLAEEREAERQATLIAEAEAEDAAARERVAGLRQLAEERAAERRVANAEAPSNPESAPEPLAATEPIAAPEPLVAAADDIAPPTVAVIPEEQIETLRREIVENVASIVENVSDNVREGVTSEVLAQTLAQTEEAIDTRFAQTQAQVAQTQAQLQQTEQVIGSQLSQTQAALQQTDRRLAEIQQSLSAQQQASQAQISQLDSRIVQLQTRDVAVAQRGALLVAVTELGDRIDSGQPFRRQLNTIEAITGGRTELSELRPFADQGLPSSDAMRTDFDEAARAALAGAKRDDADGILDKFFANLAGLFTIRPVGEAEGDSVGAVIARAEQRLEGGDLGAATDELSQLDGSAETAFADWVAAAEAKATASRGLRALEQQVTAPRRG
ncbi:MAG: mitofilin family membrane protein [Pseudomonadota bacterium]